MSAGEARERELKLGVPDADALEKLIDAAGGRRDEPVIQINHFFDTPDGALRTRAIGFRIREEGGRHIVTIKGPSARASGGALSDRVELEAGIPSSRGRDVIEGRCSPGVLIDALREQIGGGDGLADTVEHACRETPLVHIGSFCNERTRVSAKLAGTPVVLEFDRTDFGGDEERCEVELEIDSAQEAAPLLEALEALFACTGIEPTPTTSKLAHFQELLARRRG